MSTAYVAMAGAPVRRHVDPLPTDVEYNTSIHTVPKARSWQFRLSSEELIVRPFLASNLDLY